MRTLLADVDGSLAAQQALVAWAATADARWVDVRDLEPRLRLVASRRAAAEWWRRVAAVAGDGARCVVLYGSGDFHHLTVPLLAAAPAPLTVVHVDNHPDWVRFPPWLNCGGWVSAALRLPQVARVVTLGCSGDDLDWPELKSANLEAVRAGRLELYPWRHAPSRVFGDYGATACATTRGGRLHWRELAALDWDAFVDELAARLPTGDVYLTIDKDALRPADAITNWDQGQLSAAHVHRLIAALARRRRLVGADICGDYSPPRFADPFRRWLSRTDRAPVTADAGHAQAINGRVNVALLASLAEAMC